MPITDGIVVMPVGMGDISSAIGVSSLDLGTLCTSDLINMWAKYKPFKYASQGFPVTPSASTPALRQPQRETALVASNYGLTWDSTPQQNIPSVLGKVWTYQKPTGGNYPYRQLDFDGYYHLASPPISPIGDITVNQSTQSHYDFSQHIYAQRNVDSIGWDDIAALSNYYFCVAFAKNANFTGTILYKTSAETFSSASVPVLDLSTTELTTIRTNGYTHYLVCAASAPYTDWSGSIPSSTFLGLPCKNASDVTGAFTVTAGGINAGMELKWAYFQSNPTRANQFVDISEYWSERIGEYYNVGTNYYLHLGIVVTTDSTPVTLTRSTLTMEVIDNFAGATVDGLSFSGMRDENWNSVDSVTIPANTTTTVYLLTTGTTLNINSQGVVVGVETGQEKTVTIRLKRNGYNLKAFMICIKNNP